MGQYELSASQWEQLENFLPGRPGHVGVTAKDNRSFVNGVLWVVRSGGQWKDPPGEYGKEQYRERNLIERAFNKLKHWRRIATRYDRRGIYFLSALYLVSAVIWG